MANDAKFEDGLETALRLQAADEGDLAVISALTQDAVGKVGNIRWIAARRRLTLMLYRFRHEDRDQAKREKRPFERVVAALTIDDVQRIRSTGVDRADKEAVFSILSLAFTPETDGAGRLRINCAGGATFEIDVECLNIGLVDLTRPWVAGSAPEHG